MKLIAMKKQGVLIVKILCSCNSTLKRNRAIKNSKLTWIKVNRYWKSCPRILSGWNRFWRSLSQNYNSVVRVSNLWRSVCHIWVRHCSLKNCSVIKRACRRCLLTSLIYSCSRTSTHMRPITSWTLVPASVQTRASVKCWRCFPTFGVRVSEKVHVSNQLLKKETHWGLKEAGTLLRNRARYRYSARSLALNCRN